MRAITLLAIGILAGWMLRDHAGPSTYAEQNAYSAGWAAGHSAPDNYRPTTIPTPILMGLVFAIAVSSLVLGYGVRYVTHRKQA